MCLQGEAVFWSEDYDSSGTVEELYNICRPGGLLKCHLDILSLFLSAYISISVFLLFSTLVSFSLSLPHFKTRELYRDAI